MLTDNENSPALDPAQLRAVRTNARTVLVTAPPGSGKTRVLAARFASLVSSGADPSKILAVTFTNRAAREMRSRIGEMLGSDPAGLNITTFHGLCLGLLRNSTAGFTLFGRAECVAVLKGLGVKDAEKVLERIGFIKNTLHESPDDGLQEVIAAYTGKMEELNAIDLDDLLLRTIGLLEGGLEAGFTHVMVDEYQDINPAQHRLVGLLSQGADSLMAIGDPDQSIYGFRGSNPECFLDFTREHGRAEVVELATNYRSASGIVLASMALMKKCPGRAEREVRHARAAGPAEKVHLVDCPDERHEAEFVVKRIESLMGGLTNRAASKLSSEEGLCMERFSDFAVVYRTNRQADALLRAFERSSIPFQVVGSRAPGLNELVARLRGRGLEDGLTLSELVEREGVGAGLDPDTLARYAEEARAHEADTGLPGAALLTGFIDSLSLLTPSDDFDIEADRVSLMTMHMAKGLEFGVVFITGCEDGQVPLRMKDGECDMEEERRLFYVGMTRARDVLFLTRAESRRLWGSEKITTPSPFTVDLPSALTARIVVSKKKKAQRRPVQDGLFD